MTTPRGQGGKTVVCRVFGAPSVENEGVPKAMNAAEDCPNTGLECKSAPSASMLVDLPPVPREGGALAHVLTKTEAVRLLREAQLRHVGLHAPLERLSGEMGRYREMWGEMGLHAALARLTLLLSLVLLSREQDLAQLERLLQSHHSLLSL